MSVGTQLAFFWPSRTFRSAALAELRNCSIEVDLSSIWPEVVTKYKEIPFPNSSNSPGLRLVFRYIRWNLALYRTLLEHGHNKEISLKLIEKIQWRIIEPISQASFQLSKLRSSSLPIRVRWTYDMMFKVLFTRPFKREILPANDGAKFNVTFCPFADFLRTQHALELARPALCSQDYHIAKQWGVNLERTMTIAEGKPLCDFRFVVLVVQTK